MFFIAALFVCVQTGPDSQVSHRVLRDLNHSLASDVVSLRRKLWRDGFVRLPQLLPQDLVTRLRPGVVSAARAAHARCLQCTSNDDLHDAACLGCERTAITPPSFPKSFVKAKNLHRRHRVVAQLVSSPRLAHLAARLLRCSSRGNRKSNRKGKNRSQSKRHRRGVRLYQSAAFLKEWGDAPSSWHQDSAAAPLKGAMLTIWLALVQIDPSMGPLVFANGSHYERLVSPGGVEAKSISKGRGKGKGKGEGRRKAQWLKTRMDEMLGVRGAPLRLRMSHVKARGAMTDGDVRAAGFGVSDELPMRPGDATAHLGWTLHRASRNGYNLTRAQDKDQDQEGSGAGAPTRDALSIQYFCDGDSVHADMLGEPGADAAERGVPLHASDGPGVVVQLLGDDISTWIPWVMTQSVSPARPLANEFTPLLWPRQQAEAGARGQ